MFCFGIISQLPHLNIVHPDSDLLHRAVVCRRAAQRRLRVALQRLQPLGPTGSQPAVDLPHLQDASTPLELLLQRCGHHSPAGGQEDD